MSSTEDTNTKEKEDTSTKENNWKTFGVQTLQAFINILIIGLLSANFVYFTRINLDLFFPTEVNQRPYANETKNGPKLPPLFKDKSGEMKGGKKMMGGTSGGCGAPIDFTQSPLFDNKYFRGMFEYGFPYSMESKEDTFGGIITNWYSNKVKYSYVWLRLFIKAVINFMGSTCAMVPESMQAIIPFVLGPLAVSIILLVVSFWWIPTLISIFWNENQDWGMFISILGLFFGWTWSIPIILSFIQMIGVIFSFTLLPVFLNGKKIMEIMGNKYNSYYLTVLLLISIIMAAFSQLNIITAIVMTLVFLPSLIPPGMNPMAKKTE